MDGWMDDGSGTEMKWIRFRSIDPTEKFQNEDRTDDLFPPPRHRCTIRTVFFAVLKHFKIDPHQTYQKTA